MPGERRPPTRCRSTFAAHARASTIASTTADMPPSNAAAGFTVGPSPTRQGGDAEQFTDPAGLQGRDAVEVDAEGDDPRKRKEELRQISRLAFHR